MRRLLPWIVSSLLLVALTGVAAADVQIRMAVSPDTIPECSRGQLFVALANNGTAPIGVRVCFALKHDTTTVFGPFCGRLILPAGERRQHEFTFIIPPRLPAGDYAFVARAEATDGTSDQAAAPFTVTDGACAIAAPDVDTQLNSMVSGMGATPDGSTPTTPTTWGSLKIRYR